MSRVLSELNKKKLKIHEPQLPINGMILFPLKNAVISKELSKFKYTRSSSSSLVYQNEHAMINV
jgi:hypothetical protein